jgi:hypothetical protein
MRLSARNRLPNKRDIASRARKQAMAAAAASQAHRPPQAI